jgi:hypothetical protein
VSGAQQFVTDDAEIVDYRACQLEGWHGESASWALPACQLIRNLELTAGVGQLSANGETRTEYVLQAKTVLRELQPGGRVSPGAAGRGARPGLRLDAAAVFLTWPSLPPR